MDINAGYVPFDVPPITEEYGKPRWVPCPEECGDYYSRALKRPTRPTCADKTRFLMTAEDGSKHCLALSPQPKGGSKP